MSNARLTVCLCLEVEGVSGETRGLTSLISVLLIPGNPSDLPYLHSVYSK